MTAVVVQAPGRAPGRRGTRPYVGTVLTDAAELIARHGFWSGGFGSYALGFSIEGAVYEALRLRDGDLDLVTDIANDDPRWAASKEAFAAVAAMLPLPPPMRPRCAFAAVCDWSEAHTSAVAAVQLLGRAAVAYTTAHPMPNGRAGR